MKVSVLLNTFRVGGLDVSFSGLANQDFHEDWELLLCDVHYEWRKEAVKKYIGDMGYDIPLVHFAPKRTTYPIDSGSMHRNSAIAMADGELCIFLCDYAWVPSFWLYRHWNIYDKNKPYTAMGPHRYWMHPAIKEDWPKEPISIFQEEFRPEMLKRLQQTPAGTQDPKLQQPAGPITGNYFHMKNEGMKLENILKINGCDEGYDVDGGHCYSDMDMGYRLQYSGNPFYLDVHNIAEIIQIRDFYPFCERHRTPESDYAYYRTREALFTGGNLQANNYNLADWRDQIIAEKTKGRAG